MFNDYESDLYFSCKLTAFNDFGYMQFLRCMEPEVIHATGPPDLSGLRTTEKIDFYHQKQILSGHRTAARIELATPGMGTEIEATGPPRRVNVNCKLSSI